VLLCADSEMTIAGWLKYPGSKIQMYPSIKCQPTFAFAGDERFCKQLINKLALRIQNLGQEARELVMVSRLS
jgi:hypothetical protein